MGVPVGQDLGNAEVSNTLRWRDGRWETHVGILDMVKKSLAKSPNVLQLPATKVPKPIKFNALAGGWKLAAGAAMGVVVCTAAIYAVLHHNKPSPDVFAVVPDASTTGLEQKVAAVRTVDEPWIRPAPDQAAPVDAGIVVPVVPGSLAAPGAPVAENRVVTPVQAPTAVPEAAKKPQDSKATDAKPGDKKPEVKAAVILDMEPAAAAKAKEVSGVQINAAKPTAKQVSKPATGSGLVAVTPDGKAALFTLSLIHI